MHLKKRDKSLCQVSCFFIEYIIPQEQGVFVNNLVDYSEYVISNLNRDLIVDSFYLNLSKAFDVVNASLLK